MPYPSQIQPAAAGNWYNAWGFTYNAARTVVMWQTATLNTFEQWNNTTRAFIQTVTMDVATFGPVTPGFIPSWGLCADGSIYVPTQTPNPEFQPWLTKYNSSGGGATGINTVPPLTAGFTYFNRCKVLAAADGNEWVCCPSYSTSSNGYLYNHTDGGSLIELDTLGDTGSEFQIKEFVLDDQQRIWALGTYEDLTVNQLGLWLVVDATGLVDGEFHIVAMTGTQAGGEGLIYGFFSGDAFVQVFGSGVNQYISRVSATTFLETHTLATSGTGLGGREWLVGTTPTDAPFFFIDNVKYSSADLTVLFTYPYTLWALVDLSIAAGVYDSLNNAIFITYGGLPELDFGWLFLPAPVGARRISNIAINYIRDPPRVLT